MDPAHTLPADMPTACSCSGLSVQLPVLHYPHLSLTLLVINRQSGSVNNRGHCGRTGQRVWSLPMVPVYGPCVWSPCMVTVYGHCEWSPCMVTVLITVYGHCVCLYGQRVWSACMGHLYDIWNSAVTREVGPLCGKQAQNTELQDTRYHLKSGMSPTYK